MAHILRARKNGRQVYEIRIYRGCDNKTGEPLPPCCMTWPVPQGLSKELAEQKAAELEEEFRLIYSGTSAGIKQTSPSLITFQAYIEWYLREISPNRAATTVMKYKYVLSYACRQFGSLPISDITKEMIKNYFSELQTSFGHSTVCAHFKVLRLLFRSALEEEILQESPMEHLKPPRCPKDRISMEDKAYTKEEVGFILGCLNQEPVQFRTMVYFLLDTGCRRGEAAGLKWKDVDLETGKIAICANLQYLSDRGKYLTAPKSGQSRTVILSGRMLEILRQWHEWQTSFCAARKLPPCSFVFTNRKGEPMYPDTISRSFRRFGKKYGIRHFHPHALRHTMATLSILNGADVVSVSKKLGHSSPSVTLNVYSHVNEEALKKASEILADAVYTRP